MAEQGRPLRPWLIFKLWYRDFWRPWLPEAFRWHQFRFMLFSGRWIKLPKPRRRLRTRGQVVRAIRALVPRHAFYTALRFLDPAALGPPDVEVPCLGGDLVFDVDVKMPVHCLDPSGYARAAHEILELADYLADELGYSKAFYVFTGFKGFHLHICDFDPFEFLKPPPDRAEVKRLEAEAKAREEIVKCVLARGFNIDAEVTRDVKRIVRLPSTLHGRTALLSLPLDRGEVEVIETDPFKLAEKAIPPGLNAEVEVILRNGQVKELNVFDRKFDIRGRARLPLFAALLLALNGLALVEILGGLPFKE